MKFLLLLPLLILSLVLSLSVSFAYADSSIELSPDKSQYYVNEIITISGFISNSTIVNTIVNSTVNDIVNSTINSTITHPYSGEIIRTKTISVNDNYFEDTFALDYRVWKFSGDYTYNIDNQEIVINYRNTDPTDIIINFDKLSDHNGQIEYYYGETMHITGEVSQILDGENIHIVIENSNDVYDEEYNKILDSTLTVNSDRTFSFDLEIPLDLIVDEYHDSGYQVKIYYDDYYVEKGFDYNYYNGYNDEHVQFWILGDEVIKTRCRDTADCSIPNTIIMPLGYTVGISNGDYDNSHSFVSGVVINGTGVPDNRYASGELVAGDDDYFMYQPYTSEEVTFYCEEHTDIQFTIIVEDHATVISNNPPITIQTDNDSYSNNQTVNLILSISEGRMQDSFNIATYDPMNGMISFFRINNPSVGNNNIMLLPSDNNSMYIPGTYTVMVLGGHEIITFEYVSDEPHWN